MYGHCTPFMNYLNLGDPHDLSRTLERDLRPGKGWPSRGSQFSFCSGVSVMLKLESSTLGSKSAPSSCWTASSMSPILAADFGGASGSKRFVADARRRRSLPQSPPPLERFENQKSSPPYQRFLLSRHCVKQDSCVSTLCEWAHKPLRGKPGETREKLKGRVSRQ